MHHQPISAPTLRHVHHLPKDEGFLPKSIFTTGTMIRRQRYSDEIAEQVRHSRLWQIDHTAASEYVAMAENIMNITLKDTQKTALALSNVGSGCDITIVVSAGYGRTVIMKSQMLCARGIVTACIPFLAIQQEVYADLLKYASEPSGNVDVDVHVGLIAIVLFRL